MIHAPAWYTPEGSCIASRIEDDEPVIFMRSQLSTDPVHWRRVAQTALEIAEHFEQTPVYEVAELESSEVFQADELSYVDELCTIGGEG